VDGKILVCAAKASNEVVLEGADGSFHGIVAVEMQWDELVVIAFSCKVVLKGAGA